MYWHDKRGTAKDILSDDARVTFTELLSVARKARETYISTKGKVEHVEGWLPAMDQAGSVLSLVEK
jgi:hypothetical protein